MDSTEDGESRGIILGVTWPLTSIAIITVAARLYTRKQRNYLGSDDWIMVAAMTFQIAYQAILHVACLQGLGKAVKNSTEDELVNVRKWAMISSAFTNVVSVLARISISILLIRTFESKRWLRWFLAVSCVLMAIVGLLTPILTFTQIHPVQALWDFRMDATMRFSPTISNNLSFSLQIMFMLSDITYVLFPMLIIWGLNMALHRKVGVGLLMGLSLVTFAAALTKVVVITIDMITPKAPGDNDSPCFNGTYSLATGIEQALVITMGCIPTLGHAAKSMFPWLSSVGSTVAGAVSGTSSWKKHSNESDSTRYGGSGKYYRDELNLRPDCPPLDEGEEALNGPTVTAAPIKKWKSNPSIDEGAVRRVDDFTITYEMPHLPREEV